MKTLTLKETASVLALSEDEVMFMVQEGRLPCSVDEENLEWSFSLTAVLDFKKQIEDDAAKLGMEDE